MGGDLLGKLLASHGGTARWSGVSRIRARIRIGGLIWQGRQSIPHFADGNVEVATQDETVTITSVADPVVQSVFKPNVLTLRKRGAVFVDTQYNPRSTFRRGIGEADWDDFQVAYACSYSIWNCLTQPFLFEYPGFLSQDLPREKGGPDRIKITYPRDVASHSREVVVSLGEDGLMIRQDFKLNILNDTAMVSMLSDYAEVGGLRLAMARRLFRSGPAGQHGDGQPFITIDISDIDIV